MNGEEGNTEEPKKEASRAGVLRKMSGKVKAALAGAMALTGAANVQEGDVNSGVTMTEETLIQGNRMESTDSFDVLCEDNDFSWGVEYVPKNDARRDIDYVAERYVKIDKSDNKTILGEFDDVVSAADALSKMPGIPEKVLDHAKRAMDAVKTERDFQDSGLTEPKSE